MPNVLGKKAIADELPISNDDRWCSLMWCEKTSADNVRFGDFSQLLIHFRCSFTLSNPKSESIKIQSSFFTFPLNKSVLDWQWSYFFIFHHCTVNRHIRAFVFCWFVSYWDDLFLLTWYIRTVKHRLSTISRDWINRIQSDMEISSPSSPFRSNDTYRSIICTDR